MVVRGKRIGDVAGRGNHGDDDGERRVAGSKKRLSQAYSRPAITSRSKTPKPRVTTIAPPNSLSAAAEVKAREAALP